MFETSGNDHRISLLEIDPGVSANLRSVATLVEPALAGILDGFYDHMAGFDQPREILGDRPTGRLKQAQRQHWLHLFSGEFNEAYREQARAIGHAHERIGLEPTWYMGGYAFILTRLIAVVLERRRRDPRTAAKEIDALVKAVMLDMDIAISVYIKACNDKRQQQMGAIANQVEAEVEAGVKVALQQGGRVDEAASHMTGSMAALLQQTEVVSAAAAETTTNVETIAAAGEQLTVSVTEISRQAHLAQETARTAVSEVGEAAHTMEALAGAADRIGQIVKLISDVASQTNLLALNASIEAARAGDAGRGFGVVAAEVKALANRTGQATKDIAQHVEAIQSRTGAAVSVMNRVAKVIGAVNTASASIAAAVEQQTAATAEIGRNASQAASCTSEVARHITGIAEEVRNSHQFAAIVRTASGQTTERISDLETRVVGLVSDLRKTGGATASGIALAPPAAAAAHTGDRVSVNGNGNGNAGGNGNGKGRLVARFDDDSDVLFAPLPLHSGRQAVGSASGLRASA